MQFAIKKPGEHWQLEPEQQVIVLGVQGGFITLGLPATAGLFQRAFRGRRGVVAPEHLPRPGGGYFLSRAGGPCLFVVRVCLREPVVLRPGLSIVAIDAQGDAVQLCAISTRIMGELPLEAQFCPG